jgi:hypothetical protein
MQIVGPSVTTVVQRDEVLPSDAPESVPAESRLEWHAVVREHCNVLVEGTLAAVGEMIEAIRPHLRTPIQEHRPQAGTPVPLPAQGTLMLLEVAGMAPGEQARLLRWLHEQNGRVQVVTISAEPLFPLVEAGRFDASLYYRMNTVRITF